MRHSPDLRARLMWLAMLPVLMFALAWGGYLVRQRASELQAQLHQRAQLLARQLAIAADYGIFSRNLPALNNLTQGVVRESSVGAATIFDPALRVLSSYRASDAMSDGVRHRVVQDMLERFTALESDVDSQAVGDWIVFLEPIRTPALVLDDLPETAEALSNPTVLGFALVEVSTRSVQNELLAFGLKVVALLAGVLFAGWVMARRFSASINQSVQSLAKAAQEIGAGQTGVRLGPMRVPTFDRLSQDINRMAAQLETSRQELELRISLATAAMRGQRDAAQQANQAKTRFLAAASHDLRQPMQALNLLLQAMKHENNPSDRSRLLERVEAASQAMSSLLDALLDISRLDAGNVQYQKTSFELFPMLERLRNTYEHLAEQKGVEMHVLDARVRVYSDPILLERILGNFLSNAVRYTPKGGRVVLLARHKKDGCELQVRDNGPGIAPDAQAMIFEEFVQLENPQRDRSQGLGLGLAIVQRLAHLLGHAVSVRSAPGQGATFCVRVPFGGSCEPTHLTTDGAGSIVPRYSKATDELVGCRILLVEDDALVRESYGHLLQLWGCDVSEHASAEDALNFLAQSDWRPNMVVTDHRLGGVSNGRELIDLLRQHFVPSLPGVLITGDTEDTTLRTSLKPEINLLYKPVKPMILHRVLLQLWSEHTNVADVAPGELSS